MPEFKRMTCTDAFVTCHWRGLVGSHQCLDETDSQMLFALCGDEYTLRQYGD